MGAEGDLLLLLRSARRDQRPGVRDRGRLAPRDIYDEVKRRPPYVVESIWNAPAGPRPAAPPK
ncbi:MAG: hypothetical protein LC729_02830 [Acidobacteria bacterium]|nr:hypothetical protein [Acidobacteriota bacterium]